MAEFNLRLLSSGAEAAMLLPLRSLFHYLPMPPPPPSATLFPYTTLFRSPISRKRPSFSMCCCAPPRACILLARGGAQQDRKSTRLNSSHVEISYAVFCLKKKRLGCKEIS